MEKGRDFSNAHFFSERDYNFLKKELLMPEQGGRFVEESVAGTKVIIDTENELHPAVKTRELHRRDFNRAVEIARRRSRGVDDPGLPVYKSEPKPKPRPMSKVLGFVKRTISLIGGIAVGGGSLSMGVDVTTAVIFAGCTIALILGVEMATVKELKELFDPDKSNSK